MGTLPAGRRTRAGHLTWQSHRIQIGDLHARRRLCAWGTPFRHCEGVRMNYAQGAPWMCSCCACAIQRERPNQLPLLSHGRASMNPYACPRALR